MTFKLILFFASIVLVIFLTEKLAIKVLVLIKMLNKETIFLDLYLDSHLEIFKRLVTQLYYRLYLIKLASIALNTGKIAVKVLK